MVMDDEDEDMQEMIQKLRDQRRGLEEEIKDTLYSWAIDAILRGACGGLPEWYKSKLLISQFEK